MEDNSYLYFTELIKKFDFIKDLWVTDSEGGIIISSSRNDKKESEEDSENSNKLKNYLFFLLNSAVDQISKIEKFKTKNIVTFYETVTLFQSRISKNILVHFICDSKLFNYEITKEIVLELSEKLNKIEKEIETTITQNNDNV